MTCTSYIPPPEKRGIDVSPVVASDQSAPTRVPGRLRLSTAAFDRPERLDVALQDLAPFCFGPDHLVALSCRHQGGGPSSLVHSGIDCGGRGVSTSNPVAARRLLGSRGPLASAAGELRTLLTQNALVLVVLAETFAQHRKAVRILLKHAHSRVFTSDLIDDGTETGTQE